MRQIFWKTQTLFKKLEDLFLVENTNSEKATFPYKTALSEANNKIELSFFKNVLFYLLQWKPLENGEKIEKNPAWWGRYKVNFIIYDVTAWLKNNYNTYIFQYLKK